MDREQSRLVLDGWRFGEHGVQYRGARCLAEGMNVDETQATYGSFPEWAIPEILRLAAERVEAPVARDLIWLLGTMPRSTG